MPLRYGATAISYRVGQVRLDEVLPQAGKSDEVNVQVLDAGGRSNLVTVKYARKWGSTSWRCELQCQGCYGPARVLQLLNGLCLCRKCLPQPTAHHVHKNATAWASEDGIADAIVRLMMKPSTIARHCKRQRLATQLKHNILANTSNVLADAQSLITAADKYLNQPEQEPIDETWQQSKIE